MSQAWLRRKVVSIIVMVYMCFFLQKWKCLQTWLMEWMWLSSILHLDQHEWERICSGCYFPFVVDSGSKVFGLVDFPHENLEGFQTLLPQNTDLSLDFARSLVPGPNEPAFVTFVFISRFAKRDHENLTCNLVLGQFLSRTISFVGTVRFPRS